MKLIFLILFSFLYISPLNAKEIEKTLPSKTKISTEKKISKKKSNFKYWYYKPLDYGARAFHNPIQFIVEGGLPGGKQIHNLELKNGIKEVFKKVINPNKYISKYGWKKFIYYEFIPHKGKGGNWIPNYTWHLWGGGFRTRMMIEYFHYHNYKYPSLWGWTTMYIMHLLNEGTQQASFLKISKAINGNGETENDTVDPLPDLLFFDWLGGVIFSFDPINEFATKYLHLSEWSYQSQLNMATNRLMNNGQIYWMRYQLFDSPFSLNWISGAKITAPGFSYEYRKDHYLSFGFGLSVNRIAMNSKGDLVSGSTVYTLGFYYSIADNPILTVTYSMPDYKAMKLHPKKRNNYNSKFYINLYPTKYTTFLGMKFGLTFAYDRETYFVGISNANWPIGFMMGNHIPKYY